MKKLLKVLVIPCLISATFIFMTFDADKTEDLTRFRSSASVKAGKEVKSMVFEDRSDVVYAILALFLNSKSLHSDFAKVIFADAREVFSS